MDSRAARREAEKAARVLITGKVELVGDLAVASAARGTAADNVKTAKEQGKALIEEARKQSAELVNAARRGVEDAEVAYGEVFAVALSAGWTPKELADLGYKPASRPHRRQPAVKKPVVASTTAMSDRSDAAKLSHTTEANSAHIVPQVQPA